MVEISQLKSLGGRHVNVHLADGSAYAGRLRTDLLSDNSISIFLDDGAEGTTLYIDEIVSAVAAEVR